jgi:hypothetical protein
MKASSMIEKIVYTVVIILLLVVCALVFISPPNFLDVQSVYQIF